ncbi:uncharacterized protein [Euwallacea fornicatus]|uniref:uncharacterized protein n=1 Tax=Euwallacea fornicatus TaxID=995702 RepID=UPI00338EA508
MSRAYSIGELACIDEMPVRFRERCKSRMYIGSKPKKYGSEGTILSQDEKELFIPTQFLRRLCRPIINTNRNVTADNWFSSVEVVQELKNRGLTYVGTIKRNKREILQEFLPTNRRDRQCAVSDK